MSQNIARAEEEDHEKISARPSAKDTDAGAKKSDWYFPCDLDGKKIGSNAEHLPASKLVRMFVHFLTDLKERGKCEVATRKDLGEPNTACVTVFDDESGVPRGIYSQEYKDLLNCGDEPLLATIPGQLIADKYGINPHLQYYAIKRKGQDAFVPITCKGQEQNEAVMSFFSFDGTKRLLGLARNGASWTEMDPVRTLDYITEQIGHQNDKASKECLTALSNRPRPPNVEESVGLSERLAEMQHEENLASLSSGIPEDNDGEGAIEKAPEETLGR
jgi:hypothetical protein